MTQIAFIPIAAETELAYICTSGIYPICPRLSQARGFQHHLDNSSCQTVPTPGPSPEKTNLDWDYIVLSIIKLDRNQAIHLDWGNWFFSRASQIKPLDGLQQEKPSSFFMATPRLSAPSSMRLKNSYKFQSALRISFDDISLCNYRIIFKISLKYRYRIFFEK